MQLHGIHHVTCITGDAPRNLDYYTGTLGLRLVKKTVNQDDPTIYHLFYADEPLTAHHPEIPEEYSLRGFAGVRAYSSSPERSNDFLEQLTFTRSDDVWESRGGRHGFYAYDAPEGRRGIPGAGTVHHVAWSVPLDEHPAWVQKAADAGARPTQVIDRFWFRSIYFREPSGVLFEIASLGPGFTLDEEPEHLGERLILPPRFEPLRAEIEPKLTPLPVPG